MDFYLPTWNQVPCKPKSNVSARHLDSTREIRTLPVWTFPSRVPARPSFNGAANAEYKDANNTTTREYEKRYMLLGDTVVVRGRVLTEKREGNQCSTIQGR